MITVGAGISADLTRGLKAEYRRLRKYTLEEALNSMKERLGILEEKGEAGE